jgi:hypothetical protein
MSYRQAFVKTSIPDSTWQITATQCAQADKLLNEIQGGKYNHAEGRR